MTIAECQVETMKHIEKVREIIRVFTDKLTARGTEHDRLKMESPEVEIFTEYTPKLAETTYGSEEYMKHLASRFNISPQLRQIFVNTAKMFDEQH